MKTNITGIRGIGNRVLKKLAEDQTREGLAPRICSLLPCPFCGSMAKTITAQKDAYRQTFAMTGCFNSECVIAPSVKCYYAPQKKRMGRVWAVQKTYTAWNGRANDQADR